MAFSEDIRPLMKTTFGNLAVALATPWWSLLLGFKLAVLLWFIEPML